MTLKPWYKVVTPREDLRGGKPLDASEFAAHLDQVKDGRAPAVYQDPERFLERTFLTKGLTGVAAEVLRRLSGEKTETSAVFNMTTQFGGGKTHSLTLLYHLANNGPKAKDWHGVSRLLQVAQLKVVPSAKVAARNSILSPGAVVQTERRPGKPLGEKLPFRSVVKKRWWFSRNTRSRQ